MKNLLVKVYAVVVVAVIVVTGASMVKARNIRNNDDAKSMKVEQMYEITKVKLEERNESTDKLDAAYEEYKMLKGIRGGQAYAVELIKEIYDNVK